MRTTAFEEYPHETALRLKKEAGPDLYDALEKALSVHGDSYSWGKAAVAALAKARGEA